MKTNRLILSQATAALLLASTGIPALAVIENNASTTVVEPILDRRDERTQHRLILRQVINESPRTDRRREIRDDVNSVASREDVKNLPLPLYKRLLGLAARPHTYLPQTAFAEADDASQLVQHYLVDTTEFQAT